MLENNNFYGDGLNGTGNTRCSHVAFNWKHPSGFPKWLWQLIKNPTRAAQPVVQSDDITQPLVLTILNIISVFLAAVISMVIMGIRYSIYMSWLHISLAGIVIFATASAAAFDFGFPGLLFVSTGIIFREKTTFSKMLSLSGCKVIIDSIFILAGSLLMLPGNFFFFISVFIGNILSFAMLVTLYNEEIHLPPAKKIYCLSGSFAAITIVILILLKAVFPVLTSNILSYMDLMQLY